MAIDGDLSGRVAVVTGGASGIGLATVTALAARGADVLAVDVKPPPAVLPAWFVEVDVRFVTADVSEPASWQGLTSKLDRVDIAVLNAGVQSPVDQVVDTSLEDYRRVVGVNLDGVVLGTRALVPLMEAGGAVVMVASLAGLVAYAPDPLYAATKHAVVGFARAVAPQLELRGITANVVCPALTDTAFLTPEQREWIEGADFPLISVENVVDAVIDRAIGPGTGEVWVCQYGRPALRYEPRGVPGPKGSVRPPEGLAQAPR